MNYEVRLPGYGGAGVFVQRTVAGDPPSLRAVDLWLLSPRSCRGYIGRPTAADFLPDWARFLFGVASSNHPEKDLPAFEDPTLGFGVDISTSTVDRIGLIVTVVKDRDAGVVEFDDLDFETSRAVLVDTAEAIATLLGGFPLVDFDKEW